MTELLWYGLTNIIVLTFVDVLGRIIWACCQDDAAFVTMITAPTKVTSVLALTLLRVAAVARPFVVGIPIESALIQYHA